MAKGNNYLDRSQIGALVQDMMPAATDLLPELRELLTTHPDAVVTLEDGDDGELLDTLTDIGNAALAAVRYGDLPKVAGELARIQAAVTARLMAPPQPTPEEDGIDAMTAESVARRLELPVSYIREATRKGDLRSFRRGKYVRIRVADLKDWIERHLDGGQPGDGQARTPKRKRRAR